jgi:hypothetical protein
MTELVHRLSPKQWFSTISITVGFGTLAALVLWSWGIFQGDIGNPGALKALLWGCLGTLLVSLATVLFTVSCMALERLINSCWHELTIEKKGIKLQRFFSFRGSRHYLPISTVQMSWNQLNLILRSVPLFSPANVFARRPARPVATYSPPVLIFQEAGGLESIRIPVDCLQTRDKHELLAALQRSAPNLVIWKEIVDVLTSDGSPALPVYTELWMAALDHSRKSETRGELKVGDGLKDGRYEIQEKLGTGGQGTAYLAKVSTEDSNRFSSDGDPEHGSKQSFSGTDRVVLKEFILPKGLSLNSANQFISHFESELALWKTLDHADIVKFKDVLAENHRIYLVFEYIEGSSLLELVSNNGPIPERQCIDLGLQMCDMLSYLHSLMPPVVHRDFAPDNLILTPENKLKLIDFSAATRIVQRTSSAVAGKLAYIAPEQFGGNTCIQSDIYSLGATLFYVLTGSTPEAISQSHPREHNASVSQEMDAIVAKATAYRVEERYADVRELRACLEKLSFKKDPRLLMQEQ